MNLSELKTLVEQVHKKKDINVFFSLALSSFTETCNTSIEYSISYLDDCTKKVDRHTFNSMSKVFEFLKSELES